MRVALAQIDPTVGDIAGNAALAVDAIRGAASHGAKLVVFPELVLSGYPPEDLLHKAHFVHECREALDTVASACEIAAVIGFVESGDDGRLHNAAAVCSAGVVQAVYRKRHLPNYGVFDEERYFAAGTESLVVDIAGVNVAVTVCEDVWTEGPVLEAAAAGASLLVNLSASPFHAGKGREREAMLCARAAEAGLWIAYANLVGGQDELVFDGRSVVVSPGGEIVARAAAFAPDLVVADIECASRETCVETAGRPDAARDLAPLVEGPEEVYRALVLAVQDYVGKNGFADVVLGLSGGIDSALTACIAADALGSSHVHGVMMPGPYSSAGSVADARSLGENLGIHLDEIPIEPAFSAYLETLSGAFAGTQHDLTEENLQARVRGTLLMALSNKFGWLVLATGNKSESSVGYSTLYGDMVGGFAPLKDVFKTRAYELARWRNEHGGEPVIPEATLSKPPSAELRPAQTDQDSLPPYDVLDAILERSVELDESRDEIVAAGFDPETVDRVTRMIDAAEYKRRQSALGPKMTPKAFGRDRRMPVTNGYRG